VHSWNDCPTEDEGNPPVGLSYDARLDEEPDFNNYKQTMQALQRGGPLPRMRHRFIGSGEEDGDEDENED
jgi:DDB1- and CUL4-associated factor 11